jgi:hypothetical protein
VNTAAINMGVQVSLLYAGLLGRCPEAICQEQMIVLFLVILGTSIMISTVTGLIYISTNSV